MFKKLLKFLYWVWWDIRNPQKPRPFGIYVFVGLPGSGKTLGLVEQLERSKISFPKAKIYTNFGYLGQDGEITKWQDLLEYENEDDGVIFGLDEVHSIFDRKDWNKMPPEILELFSQNRKFAKQLLCTAQSFSDVVVDIRRRTHFIIECRMLARRWVLLRGFTHENYRSGEDGVYTMRKRSWRYSFIADNDIFAKYDTFQVIKNIRLQDDFSERKIIQEAEQPEQGSQGGVATGELP